MLVCLMALCNCEKCSYEWEARVDNPKSCPRCKFRFDYDEARKAKDGVE